MKFLYIPILLLPLLGASCEKIFGDTEPPKLSFPTNPYTGSELKIDGYYYNTYIYGENKTGHDIYLFYTNGVLLFGGVSDQEQILIKEEKLKNGEHYSNAKNSEEYWGNFQISGSSIKFEKWSKDLSDIYLYVSEGSILNDSTFTITQSYRLEEGKQKNWTSINETYHFKKFSPKPDSTNQFVK